MKTHERIVVARPNDLLLTKKEAPLEQEIQREERIAYEIGSPLECYEQSQAKPEIVRDEMLRRNDAYFEKMEIYEFLQEGTVKKGSLSFKHKERWISFGKSVA